MIYVSTHPGSPSLAHWHHLQIVLEFFFCQSNNKIINKDWETNLFNAWPNIIKMYKNCRLKMVYSSFSHFICSMSHIEDSKNIFNHIRWWNIMYLLHQHWLEKIITIFFSFIITENVSFSPFTHNTYDVYTRCVSVRTPDLM